MAFTGSLDAVNSAFEGLIYQPNLQYNSTVSGNDNFTLVVNDQGNTGIGGGGDFVETVAVQICRLSSRVT